MLYEITFSPTGGTKKAAQMLSEAWDCDKREVDLLKPVLANHAPIIKPEDICIVSVPVFSGRLPQTAAERLQKLKGNGAKAVAMVVYGNRAIDDALVELQDILENTGFSIIAGVEAIAEHSIARQFAAGRPDHSDEAVLRDFGEQIRAKLKRYDWSEPLFFPGNRPYMDYGAGPQPKADDACISCGYCVMECPVGAIPVEAPYTTDPQMCISCMRCISVCPKGARHLDPVQLHGVEDFLAPLCSDRKQNKLYI